MKHLPSDAYASLAGIDGILDPEALRAALPSALGGFAGGLITHGMRNISALARFTDVPWKRAVAAGGLGVLGGLGIWQVNRDAAMGWVGGMSAQLAGELASLVSSRMSLPGSTGTEGYLDDDELEVEASLMGPGPLGQLPEEQELLGLGDPAVEVETPTGFAGVSVEDEPAVPTFLTG